MQSSCSVTLMVSVLYKACGDYKFYFILTFFFLQRQSVEHVHKSHNLIPKLTFVKTANIQS